MITINIYKAKVISHDKRRLARTEEFKPYDEVIMNQKIIRITNGYNNRH